MKHIVSRKFLCPILLSIFPFFYFSMSDFLITYIVGNKKKEKKSRLMNRHIGTGIRSDLFFSVICFLPIFSIFKKLLSISICFSHLFFFFVHLSSSSSYKSILTEQDQFNTLSLHPPPSSHPTMYWPCRQNEAPGESAANGFFDLEKKSKELFT